MAEERRTGARHTVTMENREKISVTGVIDVLSFDEESIVADTDMGVLVIHGAELHVNRLNLESGDLLIDGEMESLEYQQEGAFSKNKGSLLSRIFK